MKDPLAVLLNKKRYSQDNLHLIAISNIHNDGVRRIHRWWSKKYRTPEKPFGEHTYEELLIEQLEDYYEKYPQEADRMLANIGSSTEDWDGKMPSQYEDAIQKRLKGFFDRNKVDLSKYRAEKELSEDDEKQMLEGLGRNLPRSKLVTHQLDEDEFDDDFGE